MREEELIEAFWIQQGGKANMPEDLWFYRSSWDMLMPVVEKTHRLCDSKEKEFPEEKDLDDPTGWRAWSYRRVKLSTNINRVRKQALEFIKFYNQQNDETK